MFVIGLFVVPGPIEMFQGAWPWFWMMMKFFWPIILIGIAIQLLKEVTYRYDARTVFGFIKRRLFRKPKRKYSREDYLTTDAAYVRAKHNLPHNEPPHRPSTIEHPNVLRPPSVQHKNFPTQEAFALYRALQERGVQCELEANDGHKHVDIAIPSAKLHIEIDGKHHYTNAEQMKSDIQRAHYSAQDGYKTIHIPNSQIHENLHGVADAIAEVVKENI